MPNLPTGTITFLFSDLEGSTQLWEKYPDAMRVALARHDAILRQVIQAQHGHIVKLTGDGVHAVFDTARDAIAAALAAQQGLQSENWDERTPIRARMAVHTGVAEERDGDYYGPVLNRAARLMAAGSGCQVLLSQATYGLVRDELPREISFCDLGEHRLKDLSRPEHIYQLIAPNLLSTFPQLKTLDALPNNLQPPWTQFIGRENEIAQVKAMIASTRLVTLTGIGGAGKTRLALHVAADLLDAENFRDGIWMIELAALTDPTRVAQTIARTLNVREEPSRAITQTLNDYLVPKNLLLFLDNCEHLIDECAHLTDSILRACPQIKILTTSREALGIPGEKIYRVPSLTAPEVGKLPSPEALSQYEAVRLFVDRARGVQSAFELTEQNARAVAQICARLDGIPLAIELAAARTKTLKVQDLAARLDDRFRLLAGGIRGAVPRHQTLRAMMDWSYDLLSEKERALFRRLSVFAGGWTMAAAEEIGSGANIASSEVLNLLGQLVDKSLVNMDEQAAETRYQMLETVRQYALGKLIEFGEAEELRGRHLDYFVGFAESVDAKTKTKGADQALGMKALEVEHENLRAALEWGQNETGGAEKGLRLSGALGKFWEKQNALNEGREWLKKFLDLTENSSDVMARARALYAAGQLTLLQGDHASAIELFERCLKIETRDSVLVAQTHLALGYAYYRRADYPAAAEHYNHAIQLGETIHDTVLVAWAQMRLGIIYHEHGELERALASHQLSLEEFRKAGELSLATTALSNLARIFAQRTEYEQAIDYYTQVIASYEGMGKYYNLCPNYISLGEVYMNQGNYTEAIDLLNKCLVLAEHLNNNYIKAVALGDIAICNLSQGDPDAALNYAVHALELIQRVQAKDQEGAIHRKLGEIRAILGQRAEAQKEFQSAQKILEALNSKAELARFYRSYGKFLISESTRQSEGTDYLSRALAMFEALGSKKEVENTKMMLDSVAVKTM